MNPKLFDEISQRFSDRRVSRRTALGTSLAVGAAAVTGIGATGAQDATPEGTPEGTAQAPPAFAPTQLFVQSFQSGSIAPASGEFGTHTVTLEQGMGQTISFTDRPSREVSAVPTPAFLDGLGFDVENPPNAALLMDAGDGTTDIAVVELFNPTYDEATHTATYDIAVLANWQNDLEIGFQEEPIDLSNLSTQFGGNHLFIDGCANQTINCYAEFDLNNPQGFQGFFKDVPASWWWSTFDCQPVTPGAQTFSDIPAYWAGMCNNTFSGCDGHCGADTYR